MGDGLLHLWAFVTLVGVVTLVGATRTLGLGRKIGLEGRSDGLIFISFSKF